MTIYILFLDREEVELKDTNFACSQFHKSYGNARSLKMHMSRKHCNTNFVCQICKKKLLTKSSLTSHIKYLKVHNYMHTDYI